MYDDFDDYFYPAEDDYHEALLEMESREDFYGEDEVSAVDDDLENLLDELEYPFWWEFTILESFAVTVSRSLFKPMEMKVAIAPHE